MNGYQGMTVLGTSQQHEYERVAPHRPQTGSLAIATPDSDGFMFCFPSAIPECTFTVPLAPSRQLVIATEENAAPVLD